MMTQEAPEQNAQSEETPNAGTVTSKLTDDRPTDDKSANQYADFWMRGLGAVLEALVFMALSIPVAFGLPFLITRVDASIICPEIPGFFFFEGFAPSVAFPLAAMKAHQHMTAQARIGPTEDTTMIWALVIGGLVLTNLLYHVLMESSPLQGTIGKAVIGMKVTRTDGGRPNVIQTFIRHMARMLSMLLGFGGYLMILKTAKKQALHDKLSGCVVVQVSEPKATELV